MNKSQFLGHMFENNGHIRASELVEAASEEENPFHSSFEWDNDVAGPEYRLHQARRLIRVTKIDVSGEREPQPLIHVTRTGSNEGNYFPRSIVLSQPSMRSRAYREVRRHMEAVMELLKQLEGDD
jgi:hypothetical protein